jgi:glycosyltransferase involved in cell wall biosynthesis
MKILHLISSGGLYGAEAVILNLSHALNSGGDSSVLGVFGNSKNLNLQLHERALGEGITSTVIPCEGQVDRAAVAKIRNLVVESQIDIVHAHGFKADIYAYLALRNTRVSLVSTCHTWYDNDPVVTLYGKLDRWILRKYAAIVAVSDEVKDRLIKADVAPDKVRIIKNGIDVQRFGEAAPSLRQGNGLTAAPLVGLVGRLSREKGIEVFLQAASRVVEDIPDAQFVVVGEGPEYESLNSLIDQLKLRKNADLLGRRDDMPSVYRSFDIMVSSSHQEGLPMVVLEGMASGLPVVATSVGDVPHVIEQDVSGVLVAPGDSNSLAANVISLLRNPAERRRMGDAARRRIEEEFSTERMTSNYLDIYRGLYNAPERK